MLCIFCHFGPLKPLTIRMDLAIFFDVLTSLPVSHAMLPLQRHVRQSMRHVVISAAVDRHLSQSEDVYLYIYNNGE